MRPGTAPETGFIRNDGSGARAGSGLVEHIRVADVGLVVGKTRLGVALWGDVEVGRLAPLVLGVQVPEERDAPLAAGPSAEAIGDQGSNWRVLAGEKCADLPQFDVEAEADLVVGIHA